MYKYLQMRLNILVKKFFFLKTNFFLLFGTCYSTGNKNNQLKIQKYDDADRPGTRYVHNECRLSTSSNKQTQACFTTWLLDVTLFMTFYGNIL